MDKNELDKLFKGFAIKYDSKELLEHLFATSTASMAALSALKDLVILNLSEITNKTIDELNNQYKEFNSLYTKDLIADVLSQFGEVEDPPESE